MASILLVCTGNICRSPIAEGLLRRLLASRNAPIDVGSAGTSGWDGSPAMPESIEAAAERGADISAHLARRLARSMVEDADLIVAMSAEHREGVLWMASGAEPRTFTLKEVVRLLEHLPPAGAKADPEGSLRKRVAQAHALRTSGYAGNPFDDDVADPLGLPVEAYRAVAWELEEWCTRLVAGLLGTAAPAGLQTAEG
jgi:protein-tyrosine phosphatase